MAQVIKIKQKSPEIPKKKRFEELPKKELPVKPLRISRANNEDSRKKVRNGWVTPFKPTEKSKIIKDGRKIK